MQFLNAPPALPVFVFSINAKLIKKRFMNKSTLIPGGLKLKKHVKHSDIREQLVYFMEMFRLADYVFPFVFLPVNTFFN